MRKAARCGFGCSLRTRTLVLLWIVMISCGFHLCYVKFHQSQSIKHDNESTIIAENNTPNADNSGNVIRSKRSPDIISDIGKTINDAALLPAQIANKAGETVNNVANSANSAFLNVTSGIKNTVGNAINQGSSLASDTVKNTGGGIFSGITEDVTKRITSHVIDQLKKSGVLNETTNQITGSIVGNVFDRIDERFDKLVKSIVRFIVRIYSMIGVGSSVLGIYGIHTNNPNCLTFSVVFFQFTIVSEVLLMSELNVDSNMERKVFLLSELASIDWKGLGIFEDPMMLVNAGILLIIAVSFYFLMTVKKCQFTMSEKIFKKEIRTDESLYGKFHS